MYLKVFAALKDPFDQGKFGTGRQIDLIVQERIDGEVAGLIFPDGDIEAVFTEISHVCGNQDQGGGFVSDCADR